MILYLCFLWLGCGIPSQNPLLWPERQSLHCVSYQPGYCWRKSFSKRINHLLRRLFHVDSGLRDIEFALKSQVSCVISVVQAPVVISRDHHDVSGTDSPFRETSNVYDGSAFCAGMCFVHYSYSGDYWLKRYTNMRDKHYNSHRICYLSLLS